MQFRFFTIPAVNSEAAMQELNSFLAQHKILSLNESFVSDAKHSFWAFSISYLAKTVNSDAAKKNTIDYKEVLSKEDFSIYSHLRDIRKAVAQEQGVPTYIIFTNEQLASLVTERVSTKTQMLDIHGIGQKKLEKYADLFLSYLQAEFKE